MAFALGPPGAAKLVRDTASPGIVGTEDMKLMPEMGYEKHKHKGQTKDNTSKPHGTANNRH